MTEPGAALERQYCGARTKQEGANPTCTQAAGWGTDHPGQGRCKLHGGSSLVKSGRFSSIDRPRVRELYEHYANDPDPLNALHEIFLVRALLTDYIERYDTFTDALIAWHESWKKEGEVHKPYQAIDVSEAYKMAAEVSKMIERIEKARAANAISRPDLIRIMDEMGKEVLKVITDADQLKAIRNGWLSIRV